MFRRAAIALALIFAAAPVGGYADYGAEVYHYCYVSKPPYGETVFFSESFGVKRGVDAQGIQLAFNAFVAARFEPSASAGARCMGPYETAREAADQLNDHIGERRRSGKDVVMTRWRYSGD